jgi:hypothetical protein
VNTGFISDPSGIAEFTAVTFMNAGGEITINFCGDQGHLFPTDATVRTDYTAGTLCSVLVRVVVGDELAELGGQRVSPTRDPWRPSTSSPRVNPHWSVSLACAHGAGWSRCDA